MAEQPLLVDVPVGTAIEVDLWHQALFSDETDATGHVALAVGEEVVWEIEVPIPFPPTVWREVVTAPRDLRMGEPVVLHIHNHGANSWNLGGLTAMAE